MLTNRRRKSLPHRSLQIGQKNDDLPGIVFKLYPTVVSRKVSDYFAQSFIPTNEKKSRKNSIKIDDDEPKRKRKTSKRPSHIIGNKLLCVTSRRISASQVVDGRQCAACFVTMTPYWRDGWSEDLMLCNACGLRFQKFMKRCRKCCYIPRKEDNDSDHCPQCNDIWI